MPNVHIKTAARNLQQAVSDIDVRESQIQSEKEDLKRSIDNQINEIRKKLASLTASLGATGNNGDTVLIRGQMKKMNDNISDLEKRRFEIENDSKKQIDNLESKKSHIKNVSGNLQSIA